MRENVAAIWLATVLQDCNPGDIVEVDAAYLGLGGYLPLRVRAFRLSCRDSRSGAALNLYIDAPEHNVRPSSRYRWEARSRSEGVALHTPVSLYTSMRCTRRGSLKALVDAKNEQLVLDPYRVRLVTTSIQRVRLRVLEYF